MIIHLNELIRYLDNPEQFLAKVKSGEIQVATEYTPISRELIENTEGVELQILVQISRNVGEDGWANVQYAPIAFTLRCSDMTIRRAVTKLRDKGILIQKAKNSSMFRFSKEFFRYEFVPYEKIEAIVHEIKGMPKIVKPE